MLKILGLSALLLILIPAMGSIATYGPHSAETMPLTILRFLPQDIHYAAGTQFDFACIGQDTWERLTDPQQEVLFAALDEAYPDVYIGINSVPKELRVFGTVRFKDGEDEINSEFLAGLNKGCLLSWNVKSKGYL